METFIRTLRYFAQKKFDYAGQLTDYGIGYSVGFHFISQDKDLF